MKAVTAVETCSGLFRPRLGGVGGVGGGGERGEKGSATITSHPTTKTSFVGLDPPKTSASVSLCPPPCGVPSRFDLTEQMTQFLILEK